MKKLLVISVAAFVLVMSRGLREVAAGDDEGIPRLAQVVALDECDPVTFNAAVGPDFCRNVTLGAFTTLSELFALAEAGTPDPGWDFEPEKLTIKQGTILSVVDQGGEPHTFTEVKEFGNGFIPQLNPGSATSVIPECSGGFKKHRGGQDANPSGKSPRYHGPFEGQASLRMLHPSLDAHGNRREVIHGRHHCSRFLPELTGHLQALS
jgi:hypothetical protein